MLNVRHRLRHYTYTKIRIELEIRILFLLFDSDRSPRCHSVCVCLSVCPSGTNLSRALNLQFSASDSS